ncbi:hypothetical protein QBC35DRAFT_493933 [Podospora australis]|uniref:Secreted protein n=1 Tax=Podospora australis TaxID=1536484 RepID=A0AAN7AJ79_9PEZI|nr:hypothetical protein QBC35DRAFT_493933 [Podospora australis]
MFFHVFHVFSCFLGVVPITVGTIKVPSCWDTRNPLHLGSEPQAQNRGCGTRTLEATSSLARPYYEYNVPRRKHTS